MTTKDRNLNLPESLGADARNRRGPAKARPQRQGARPQVDPVAAAAHKRAGSPLIPVLVVLTLLNLLAVAAGGYWGYTRIVSETYTGQPGLPAVAEVASKMESMQADLLALQRQMGALQAGMAELQQLTNTELLDIREQIAQRVEAAPAVSDAPPPAQQNPKQWVVNAGTFASAEASEAVRQPLADMGLDVRQTSSSAAGQTVYSLQIVGFEDRGAAEKVARRIMAQTRVDGIWVGKDE